MDEYEITFARSARKELEKFPAKEVGKIFPKIEALAQEPRPSSCCKLVGESNLWRIRIGSYRVVYSVDDDQHMIDIVAVRHRSEAYR